MYSFLNLEPVHCSISGSNCCFLTCIQISQEAVRWCGIPISLGIFQFVVIHTVQSCVWLCDPMDWSMPGPPVCPSSAPAVYSDSCPLSRWCHLPISLRIFQFVVIYKVKGFSVVNEAEVDFFFFNSLDFSIIQWMLVIWCLVPLPFLNPACTSGSSWFMYCWSLARRILSITLLACEMNVIVR